MKKFILTSDAWSGEITLEYDDLHLLINMNLKEAELSEEQHLWFLRNMPRELAELQKLLDKSKSAKLTEAPQEVTFEMFWDAYDEKVRSSKKKALKVWSRMTDANRLKAYLFIPKYNRSILPGCNKKYAETYLNAELWNN
jgi:hypothetical protein